MVFFTCQHCGTSVSKSKVEKHYSFQCRNSPYVTCVDCLKDFRGNEYVAHTECLTEDQKYGGKGYVPKTPPSVKKRATWLSSVESALITPGLTSNQKNFIRSCLNYSNLPQKRKKFHNFVKSAFGRACPNDKLIDDVFNILEETHKRNVEKENADNKNKNTDLPNNENSSNVQNSNVSENTVIDNEKYKNGNFGKSKKQKYLGENNRNEISDEMVAKKKKKKDKKKEKLETEDNADVTGDQTNVELEESIINNDVAVKELSVNDDLQSECQSEKKLSKKEKKEKKKRLKYEAELNEIEKSNNQNNNDENLCNNDLNDNEGIKKKKKKKDKKKILNGCDQNSETVNEEIVKKKKRSSEENETEEPVKKKSKAMITENTIEDSVVNDNDADKSSFKWDEMIIKVLESRSGKELSVNRLSKKIINEYHSIYGENHMTYEKLLAKFNKKIHKIPGVKVLKDKIKLSN